jgi:hypothetical protein
VPRPLATFEEAAHLPRPATQLPDDVPLDVADNRAARTDRLVVIVRDDLFFQARTEQVRDVARRLVREIGDRASSENVAWAIRPYYHTTIHVTLPAPEGGSRECSVSGLRTGPAATARVF